MEFFDSLIQDFDDCLTDFSEKSFAYSSKNIWNDIGRNEVILQRDTAFELEGTGFSTVTEKPLTDEVIIIGDDLNKLSGKRKFARLSVVEIDCDGDEQKLYNLIRKIDYVKYHFFPEGYMVRTSSRAYKEAVRVSQAAVKKGISFEKTGNLLISKYKEIPAVKAVKVYFITDASADFRKIEALAQKNNSIAETLNHIINSVNFDCDTCNLKAVCDEVEGMKELHFKNAGKGM